MGTPAITPAAPATAAPVAATAPTATPAVSTPASTPAPVIPVTPVTPASPDTSGAPLSSEDTVAAMVAAADAKGFGEKKEGAADALPIVELPTNVDAAAAEATPAAADPGAASAEAEEYSFDEDGFVGAKDLAAKIEANAALKAALPEDVRNEIMANARLAEFGAGMREIFASPEEATIVSESAQQFAGIVEAFQGVAADQQAGTTGLVQKIIEMSALLNPDGTPQKDKDGNFLTDGTAGKFFDTIFERKFGRSIIAKVKALGDENVQAALDLVMESVGMRPSTAVQDQVTDPALAARKAELDSQQAEITRQREETKTSTWKTYNDSVDGELVSISSKGIESLLSKATGLDTFTRGAVEEKIDSALRSAIKLSTAYQIERRKIEAMGPTAERRQKEVALAKSFLRDNLGRISKPILMAAGISLGKKVEARQEAQAARVENARSEINGGAPVAPVQAQGANATQQRESIAAELKAKTGVDPSESDISVAMMMKAAAAKGFS